MPRNEPKPAPIFAIGSFASPDPPVPERDGAGDELYKRHAWADFSLVPMVGRDCRVSTVPFGFRCEGINDPAADQATERRDHNKQPGMQGAFRFDVGRMFQAGDMRRAVGEKVQLATGLDRLIAGHGGQRVMKDKLPGRVKHNRAQASDHADHQR